MRDHSKNRCRGRNRKSSTRACQNRFVLSLWLSTYWTIFVMVRYRISCLPFNEKSSRRPKPAKSKKRKPSRQ